MISVELLDSHIEAVLCLDRQLGQVELVAALNVANTSVGISTRTSCTRGSEMSSRGSLRHRVLIERG